MKMTIDDNMDFLNETKKFFEYIANNPSLNETIKTHSTIESLESAINVMHNYQKIQEIVAKWKVDTWTDNFSYECMSKIAEIIDKAESEAEG